MKVIDVYMEDGKVINIENMPIDYTYCVIEEKGKSALHPVHAIKLIIKIMADETRLYGQQVVDIKRVIRRVHQSYLGT